MRLQLTVLFIVAALLCGVAGGAAARTVNAPCGTYQGVSDGGADAWFGIQYARETSGANRFAKPVAIADFNGVYAADNFSPACLQVPLPFMPLEMETSENSLTLNVWAPKNAQMRGGLPVCVFIHGGGYTIGSGSENLYNGSRLAAGGEMVFVTINYRLGCEGFLYLAEKDSTFAGSGNLGLLDQIAALKWVRRNIAAFGGDPDNVTIMGESAGAGAVACLLTMPEARGLFRKAIIESGGYQLTKGKADAAAVTKRFMQLSGCSSVAQLQALTAGELMETQRKLMDEYGWLATETLFAPVRGDEVLPLDPLRALQQGSAKGVELLVGTNDDEMNLFKQYVPFKPLMNLTMFRLFVPEDALSQLGNIDSSTQQFYEQQYPQLAGIDMLFKVVNDAYFHTNAYRLADAQSANGGVYMYRFDWKGQYGAVHALELPFVFGNVDDEKYNRIFMGDVKPDARVTNIIQPAWIEFISSGDPSQSCETLLWARYDDKFRPVMKIGATAELRCDIDGAERRYWYNH